MSLNKVNYSIDPNNLTKEESGKSLGKWKEYQKQFNDKFDPTKPFFIVCYNNIVIIDFDMPTKVKLEKDAAKIKKNKEKGRKYTPQYTWLNDEFKTKILQGEKLEPWPIVERMLKEYSFPIDDNRVYIVETGNGGFHYYIKISHPKNFKISPNSFLKTKDFISVDVRTPIYDENGKETGGGLVYGVGTKWKDSNEYKIYKGNENHIPEIEGWRVAWFLGILNHEVHLKDEPVINLCEFLNGKVDLHGVLKNRGQGHEMVVYRETMYLLKHLGYTKEEFKDVLSTLPNFNPVKTNTQINAWWNKETDPKRVKAKKIGEKIKTIEEIRNTISSWNRSIFYKELKTKTQEIRICETGIYKDDITADKQGNVKIYSECLWQWNDFKITSIFVEPESPMKYKRFSFELNGSEYEEKTLKQMTNIVADWSLIKSSTKSLFGKMVYEMIDEFNPPVFEYSNICGFTVDGWRLPGDYYISFTAVQKEEIKENICEMLQHQIDETKARNMMKLLYDSIKVEKNTKDMGFAWAIISPFMYALREYTELMPFFSLGGISGDKGKTAFGKILVNWIWNTLAKTLINPDQIHTKSRALEYFSSSTFPIGIDDCQKLSDSCNSEIKTYLTSETTFLRKNPYQDSEIKRPLQAPILLTYNTPPVIYDDKAFLTRGIDRQLTRDFSEDDIKLYDIVKGKIPRGYLGKYIIEKTRDWNIKNILDIYEDIDNPSYITDKRRNEKKNRTVKIYKILQIGASLCKEFFGIELDLKDVIESILETHKINNQGVLDLVERQFTDAVKKEVSDTEGNSERIFKPHEKWIRSELYEGTNQNNERGYYYRYANLQDVIRNSNLDGKTSLPEFCNILQDYMPDGIILEVKTHNNQYTRGGVKAIWIPRDYNEIFRISEEEKLKNHEIDEIKTNIMELEYNLPDDKLYIVLKQYQDRFGLIDTTKFYQLLHEVRNEMK